MANTVQNECPESWTQGAPGTANQWICYESICICSRSFTNIGGNLLETDIMGRNLHRKPREKVCKLTESLKNVIHIMGNANQALETLKCLLILDYC